MKTIEELRIKVANDLKKKYSKQEMMNSCKNIIIPRFFNLVIEPIIENQENIHENYRSHWLKLLKDVNLNRGQLSEIILASFGYYNGTKESLLQLNTNSHVEKNCVMVWVSSPTRTEMRKLKKLFVETLKNTNYHIEVINSDETSNAEVEKKIKKLIPKLKEQGKRLIMISKQMASRSFSISEIDTEFLWYDGGSVEATTQKISRPLTGGKTWNGEKKKFGNILSFSFDPNREETTPVDDYLVREAERVQNDNLHDSIKRVLNSMYMFTTDEYGLVIEFEEEELLP